MMKFFIFLFALVSVETSAFLRCCRKEKQFFVVQVSQTPAQKQALNQILLNEIARSLPDPNVVQLAIAAGADAKATDSADQKRALYTAAALAVKIHDPKSPEKSKPYIDIIDILHAAGAPYKDDINEFIGQEPIRSYSARMLMSSTQITKEYAEILIDRQMQKNMQNSPKHQAI